MTEALRVSVRAAIKELVWLGVRYQPGEQRPIALFCTRRGGSTWLLDMIGADRGMLPLDQPLELLTPNLTPYQYRRLPKFDRGQIVHPAPDQLQSLANYCDELMAGLIRVNAPHEFWRRDFHWRTDRLVLKTCDAKPMMDWLARRYDLDVVYLTRHPVPQALSCIRNGWYTTTSAYLDNEAFVAETIDDPALIAWARQRERDGTELERFVLNWVIENLYPLQRLADRPTWYALGYEECVLHRERVLSEARDRLGLRDLDAIRRVAHRPSRSTELSGAASRAAIRRDDRDYLVAGWQKQVSSEDRLRAQEILDRFDVRLYSTDEAMPDWSSYGR